MVIGTRRSFATRSGEKIVLGLVGRLEVFLWSERDSFIVGGVGATEIGSCGSFFAGLGVVLG